jgi:hypothetical protein
MAQDHTPYTDTVIRVLSLTDPEISSYSFRENIIIRLPRNSGSTIVNQNIGNVSSRNISLEILEP